MCNAKTGVSDWAVTRWGPMRSIAQEAVQGGPFLLVPLLAAHAWSTNVPLCLSVHEIALP